MKVSKWLTLAMIEEVVKQEMKSVILNPYTPEAEVEAAKLIYDYYSVEEWDDSKQSG